MKQILINLLIKKKKNLYFQSWTKLDIGSKINRLILFSIKCKEIFDLTDEELNKLKELLINACNKNKLNKISYVSYDKELGEINEIKILEFNNIKRVFNLKFTETKSKPKHNSKSNIERLLK